MVDQIEVSRILHCAADSVWTFGILTQNGKVRVAKYERS